MKAINSLIMRLTRDLNLLDQVLVSGGAFLLQLILAAWMGMEKFGIFSGWQIVGLMVLSMQQALFVSVHQVNYRDGKSTGHHYSMQVFYLNAVIIVPSAIVMALLGWWSQMFYLQPSFVGAIAAWLLFDTLRRISITEGKLKSVVAADLIALVILAAGVCSLHHTVGLSPERVVLCMCVSHLFASIFIWQSIARVVFKWKGLAMVWQLHWKQARWLLATTVLQMAGSNFFLLCCGWWIGPTALGALRLVQSIFGIFSLFFQYFENKFMPGLAAASDNEQTWTDYMRMMYQHMHRIGLGMIALAVMAMIPLWYWTTGDMIGLILGFLILQVLIVVGIPIRMGIRSQKENKSIFSAYTLCSIFSLLSAKFLITTWGVHGAVIGLCLAQLVMIIYWMNILKTKFNFPWKLYM
jgi:O-antigen/teichoic acid export membrane protein